MQVLLSQWGFLNTSCKHFFAGSFRSKLNSAAQERSCRQGLHILAGSDCRMTRAKISSQARSISRTADNSRVKSLRTFDLNKLPLPGFLVLRTLNNVIKAQWRLPIRFHKMCLKNISLWRPLSVFGVEYPRTTVQKPDRLTCTQQKQNDEVFLLSRDPPKYSKP